MNIPDKVIEEAVAAYRAPRLHVNDTVHDRLIDMGAAARVIAEWAFERAAVEAWNIGMKYAPGSQHDAIMRIPSRLRELKDQSAHDS